MLQSFSLQELQLVFYLIRLEISQVSRQQIEHLGSLHGQAEVSVSGGYRDGNILHHGHLASPGKCHGTTQQCVVTALPGIFVELEIIEATDQTIGEFPNEYNSVPRNSLSVRI